MTEVRLIPDPGRLALHMTLPIFPPSGFSQHLYLMSLVNSDPPLSPVLQFTKLVSAFLFR